MLLIPCDGTDYASPAQVVAAYNAHAEFICLDDHLRRLINRSDIVRYTGLQQVTVLYQEQTRACVVDARFPCH